MASDHLKHDAVNHPSHYTSHPSGVECIQITEHHNFCVGNAMKYMWRAGLKGDTSAQQLEDLKKARWYLTREIERLEHEAADSASPATGRT
jgi:hypothetical protein